MRMAVHAFGRCPGLSRCPLERGLLYVRGLSPFLNSQSSKPASCSLLVCTGNCPHRRTAGGGGLKGTWGHTGSRAVVTEQATISQSQFPRLSNRN